MVRYLKKNPWFALMRPHQWIKNLLLFVPLIAAHQFFNWPLAWPCFLGFVCMSLTASAIYALNDVVDASADRQHPQKSCRPVACGQISPRSALRASLFCILLAGAFLFLLPPNFLFFWIAYLLAVSLYIFGLKRFPGVDVIFLTIFYLLRIYMGGAATEITPSWWVMGFATCSFLSLALMKRSAEVQQNPYKKMEGRPYGRKSLFTLNTLGILFALLAGLSLVIYAGSDQADLLYQNPVYIYAAAPLVWAWFARVWGRTLRSKMEIDPVDFALRDFSGYLVVLGGILLGWLAV